MDAWSAYVCAGYVIVLGCCVVGAFDKDYDANLMQRVALFLFALWSAWRVQIVFTHGWGYPHETLVVSALLLYAAGSVFKTLKWRRRKSQAHGQWARMGHPMRRKEDCHGRL